MITDADNAYIYGPDGLPLEQIGPTGTVRYFSHDQLGSTTQLTNASGAVVQSYAYDAHGQRTSSTPTIPNPFQYAGQCTDATTGLQYLRARYHDPTTSQFLSPDPLQDTTDQPYSYANNDPINNTDPTGQLSWSTVSDFSAGALDGLSGGCSTKFAGSIFHFDADCADFGSGFGTAKSSAPSAVCSAEERRPSGYVESEVFEQPQRQGAGSARRRRPTWLRRDGSHVQKARERANQIDKVLRRRTDLSDYDRNMATRVRDELREALRATGK